MTPQEPISMTIYEFVGILIYTIGLIFAISKVYFSLAASDKKIDSDMQLAIQQRKMDMAVMKREYDLFIQEMKDDFMMLKNVVETSNNEWRVMLQMNMEQNNEAHEKIVVQLDSISKILKDLEIRFAKHQGEHNK
jgi:hypothetical protein